MCTRLRCSEHHTQHHRNGKAAASRRFMTLNVIKCGKPCNWCLAPSISRGTMQRAIIFWMYCGTEYRPSGPDLGASHLIQNGKKVNFKLSCQINTHMTDRSVISIGF